MIRMPSNVFPELKFPFDFSRVSEAEYQSFLTMFEDLLTHMGLASQIAVPSVASYDMANGHRVLDYPMVKLVSIIEMLGERRLLITTGEHPYPGVSLRAFFVPAVGSPIPIKTGSGIDFTSAFADLILDSTDGNLLYHLSWDVEHAAAWLSSDRVE